MGENAGLAGPAVAFLAIAILALVARLLVGGGESGTRGGIRRGGGTRQGGRQQGGRQQGGRQQGGRRGGGRREGDADDDFGLLRVAALTDDRAGAEVVRALLAGAGIRATIATGRDDRARVLVFAADLDRARTVVSGPPA